MGLDLGIKTKFIGNIFNKKLQNMIFFVTARCNSKCIGCFNWKELNKKDDLTLEEIEKISKSMPKIEHILFSGGEPTLREDLAEICNIFRKNNKIRSVSIPTNGLLPKRIVGIVKEIILRNDGLLVGIHFSLDGLEKTHDYLRGVDGNFKKVQKTIQGINLLKKEYPKRIDTSINTVISNKNYKELPALIDFVKKLDIEDHTFDLLRGSVKENRMIDLPNIDEIKKINDLRLKTKKYYLRKRGIVHRMFSVLKEAYLISSQMRIFANKKLGFKCLAGDVSFVMTHRGEIALCELRKTIGELRKENYDFIKVWNNGEAIKQRKDIAKHNCDCTHTCFLSMSIDHSPKIIFWKMLINYFL